MTRRRRYPQPARSWPGRPGRVSYRRGVGGARSGPGKRGVHLGGAFRFGAARGLLDGTALRQVDQDARAEGGDVGRDGGVRGRGDLSCGPGRVGQPAGGETNRQPAGQRVRADARADRLIGGSHGVLLQRGDGRRRAAASGSQGRYLSEPAIGPVQRALAFDPRDALQGAHLA